MITKLYTYTLCIALTRVPFKRKGFDVLAQISDIFIR